MGIWSIDLEKQTATSINGITFKLTETKPGNITECALTQRIYRLMMWTMKYWPG